MQSCEATARRGRDHQEAEKEGPLMLTDPDPGAVVKWLLSRPPSTCTATRPNGHCCIQSAGEEVAFRKVGPSHGKWG